MTASSFSWSGCYVSGARPCATVRYVGHTNTKGARWIATLKRGKDAMFRASVPYTDGPLAAADLACQKANVPHWKACDCASLDGMGDEYVVLFSS
jgi:hypothetical protein